MSRSSIALFVLALFCASWNTPAVAQRTSPGRTNSVTNAPTPSRTANCMRSLRTMGYWTSASDSANTAANKQAIIAFQKLHNLKRTGKLNDETSASIEHAGPPYAHDSSSRRHVEIDLNHQVLLMVDSINIVQRVLSISTGSGKYFETEDKGGRYAMTPRGHFHVYYKISGWRKSPIGMLYYPLYITGGVAIHGAEQVPSYPASHGCIRIPMYAAKQFFTMTSIGTPVLVFGENPAPTR